MTTTISQRLESSDKLAALLETNVEKLLTCVHCGLCLPACPTYRELGNENDSPRGRIYLMRAVSEGKIGLSEAFTSHIDLCLGCRACETSCPSGVPYGQLLEAARAEIAENRGRSLLASTIRFVLNHIFTRPALLSAALTLVRWFRDSSLASLLFESKALEGTPRFALALLLASRTPLRGRLSSAKYGGAGSQGNSGSTHGRDNRSPDDSHRTKVAVLRGCVMDGLFGEVNRASERILARSGYDVVEAREQVCCGALHAHAGEIGTARRLARKNIQAFRVSECDRIATTAAGCGAAMKEYGDLLADDPTFAEEARRFSGKVRDISELLVESGFRLPRSELRRRVAYDAPCHLMHAQRVARAPVALLESIPGVELVPLAGSENCCGGAGIYNIQHPELSRQILSKKVSAIKESGADSVATGNPGCIMQIGAGAMIEGLQVEVLHPIELLDEALNR